LFKLLNILRKECEVSLQILKYTDKFIYSKISIRKIRAHHIINKGYLSLLIMRVGGGQL